MTPDPERRRRLERLERLAGHLDSRFRILGVPVGWDSILGLFPVVGDLVTALPAGAMIYEGYRSGARKRVLARMALNGGIDLTLGGIPVLGDAFDVFFKSHKKNIALLRKEIERIEKAEMEAIMAKRHRSNDGKKETDQVLGEEGQISHQGRADGELKRNIGTKDEKKRANERPAGATRVTKSEEQNDA